MLAGWRRKRMRWRSGGMGLCKEVGQEGVGRLAPEGNELSCWMLWGWYEKRICSGRYWSSRKQWFWMLKKYAPRVFASGKPKLQKAFGD